jgi:hypothetical protein
VQTAQILKVFEPFRKWFSNHMHLKQRQKDIFINELGLQKSVWHKKPLTVKGIGRQNLVFGILSQRGIAHKLGIINPLWLGLNSTVFISPPEQNAKMFIIPFKE